MVVNLVAGLGETGSALYEILNEHEDTGRYDPKKKIDDCNENAQIVHICIPYNDSFEDNLESIISRFKPSLVIIHSTVAPYTTKKLQENNTIPIIYSAIRGVHARMKQDLQRYTKYWAIEEDAPNREWAEGKFREFGQYCGIMEKQMSSPLTLEFAKILVDTTYYGYLISYAQQTKLIADEHKIDHDEMWLFSDEIHELLGNRPKMYAGVIGGHCVLPNLELLPNGEFSTIETINKVFKASQS